MAACKQRVSSQIPWNVAHKYRPTCAASSGTGRTGTKMPELSGRAICRTTPSNARCTTLHNSSLTDYPPTDEGPAVRGTAAWRVRRGQREWLYGQQELRDRIIRLRKTQTLKVPTPFVRNREGLSRQNIVKTLRLRIKTLEEKNRESSHKCEFMPV